MKSHEWVVIKTHEWARAWNYTISSILRTFQLVSTYDLLKNGRINDVTVKFSTSLYCIKQIDSMLPCACSITITENVKMWQKHPWHNRLTARVPLFLFLPHFTSSVIYWTHSGQHKMHLLDYTHLVPEVNTGSSLFTRWSTRVVRG